MTWRTLARVAVTALLIALGVAYARDVRDGRFGLGRLVVHPATLDGERVVLSLVRRAGPAADGRFVVRKSSDAFTVLGEPLVADGEELTVIGRYEHASRLVRAEAQYAAPGRRAKKWLGGLGLVLVGALVLAQVRLTRAGWGLRG